MFKIPFQTPRQKRRDKRQSLNELVSSDSEGNDYSAMLDNPAVEGTVTVKQPGYSSVEKAVPQQSEKPS